jgi:hypothetical protein
MTSAAPSTSVESSVAGFIVWLARQRSPIDQRRHCPDTVERFLRWQRQHCERDQGSCHTENDYYAQIRRCGAVDAQVDEARTAISLFRRYLLASD